MSASTDPNRTRIYVEQWMREGALIALITLAAYLALALFSYHAGDPGWSSTGRHTDVQNATGRVGAWLADVLRYFFGYVSYLLPFGLALKAVSLLRRRQQPRRAVHWPMVILRGLGFVVLLVTCCSLLGMYSVAGLGPDSGGVIGRETSHAAMDVLNQVGSTMLFVALLLTSVSLATGLSWLKLMDWVGGRTLQGVQWCRSRLAQGGVGGQGASGKGSSGKAAVAKAAAGKAVAEDKPSWFEGLRAWWQDRLAARAEARRARLAEIEARRVAREPVLSDEAPSASRVRKSGEPSRPRRKDGAGEDAPLVADRREEPVLLDSPLVAVDTDDKSGKALKIEPFRKHESEPVRRKVDNQVTLFEFIEGPLPSINLLDPPDNQRKPGYSREQLEHLSRLLEQRLQEFNVDVEVTEVNPGPVITRFEVQPAPGVKVSKISGLAKDLARALAVISVRVVEVIPGKSVIGIEIPNENRQMVRLSQVLSSSEYQNSESPLTMALGYDIAGNSLVANLAKMPHLLVAGTTGSGKSVGVNAMLISMLYKATPDDLRLIMIDPKMLELSVYEGIPHLLTPVVTDMKEADNALRWCVGEMERRYRLMAALGVRNIAGYNAKVKGAIKAGQPLLDPLWRPQDHALGAEPHPELGTLPFIVVVVDEFADMMMIVGKKVEEKIARIAQKARAAGIHLILATQRPSVDVITGLIKANIPTRIAFQVSSKIDSRTILDQGGAEQLLGHGDMLYLPPGTGLPIRVHGAFVADEEVHRVVSDWKQRGEPNYLEEILDGGDQEFIPGIDPAGSGEQGGEQDALFDEALAFVTESRKASISAVQRKLRIGYNRAATLVEALEAAGVVSPAGHNGMREVLAPPPPRD